MKLEQFGNFVLMTWEDAQLEYAKQEAIEFLKNDIRERIEVDERSWAIIENNYCILGDAIIPFQEDFPNEFKRTSIAVKCYGIKIDK